MRYRYLVDLRRGISVFAIFSYGIAVLGTPQCPPLYTVGIETRIALRYYRDSVTVIWRLRLFKRKLCHVQSRNRLSRRGAGW